MMAENEGGGVAGAPLLMLDTGGHMALINAIAFTPDGGQLVSASEDKTIRVWDLATGKTVRTIRGESAPGDQGKIYAMALSPDGKWLAAGGFFDGPGDARNAIRLYDFASGRLVALLKGHENVVSGLAFSSDGRHLISGSGDFTAIIWDTGSPSGAGVETRRPEHRLRGHGDHIYAVGFTPDGARAVTGSNDHELRLWRVADGGEIARMPGHGDKVVSLAVAPDGTIASGDDSGEIRLWDGGTGAFGKVLARQGTDIGSLSVSPDGKRLLSGVGTGPHHCHVYDLASGQEVVTYSGHDNIVIATAISPDGHWAATGGGGNSEIHLWDLASGERRPGPDGQPLTLGGQGWPVWAAGFSADGTRVGWGNLWESHTTLARNPLQHELALPSAADVLPRPRTIAATQADGFLRATASQGEWSLEHRKGGNYGGDALLDIKRNGEPMQSIERGPTDGYQHSSYSFTRDGETIISGGTGGRLTAYDRQVNNLGDFIGHEGDVWAVAPSSDGRFLVSGAGDQTLRLWNLQTRELLVTLFHGADGEWVMWTPQGYYISSPEGDRRIGWQVNRGPDKEARYVRASQLASRLFRPDIVARSMELGSAEAALAEMGEQPGVAHLLAVPEFRVVHPDSGATIRRGAATVTLEVEANPDPVEDCDIFVNGRQVADRDTRSLRGVPGAADHRTLSVPLEKGENHIRIVARNRLGTAEQELILRFLGEGGIEKRGTLYVVAVGVDDYAEDVARKLRFAGADAHAFCEAMRRHVAPLHERMECRILAKGGDCDPIRANIENAMLLFREARPQDTVALFLAGHGTYDQKDYVFLPQDTAMGDKHLLPATLVRWHVFQNALHQSRGRRLLFVDTCHAGGAYNTRLVKEAHDSEIIVFSATDSQTKAEEKEALGHGAFTFALMQGLRGEAVPKGQSEIQILALQNYVCNRVSELTGGRQEPTVHLSGAKNFVIAQRAGA